MKIKSHDWGARFGWPLLSLVLLIALVAHWRHPGEMIQGGDNFFGYDPLNELVKGFLIWNHFGNYLGGGWSSGTWAPWLLVAGILTHLVGSEWAQLVMITATMAGGWLGFYLLARELYITRAGAAIGAWAYTVNPWQQIFSGTNYPLNWLVSLLPWYAILLLRLRDPERVRASYASIAALSLTLLCVIGANPGLVVTFFIGFAIAAIVGAASTRHSLAYLRRIAAAFCITVSCSLWWLFLIARHFIGARIATAADASDWSFVVSRSTFLNNLRFDAIWGWDHPEYFSYAKAYDHNPLTYASGFLLYAALCVGLATARGRRLRIMRLLGAVALVAIFLSKGLHPPLEALNGLFYRLPLSGLFREPTGKFPVVTMLVLGIALSYTVDALHARLRLSKRRRRVPVLFVLPLATTALSGFYFITGQQFHGYTLNYHTNVVGLPPVFVSLPDYWKRLNVAMRSRSALDGVLVLPADLYYQVDYDWGYYGADYLPNWLLPQRVLIPGLTGYTSEDNLQAVSLRLLAAVRDGSPLAAPMLRDLGIRYVLYRGDVPAARDPFTAVTASDVTRTLPNATRTMFGPLTLYDLGGADGPIRSTPDVIAASAQDTSASDAIETRAMTDDVPRLSQPEDLVRFGVQARVFEPTLKAVETNDWSKNVGSSLAGAPIRIVAHGALVNPSLLVDASAREATVRASYLGQPETPEDQTVVSTAPVDFAAVPLALTPDRVYADEDGTLRLALFNPTDTALRTAVDISIPGGGTVLAVLASSHGSVAESVAASSGPRFVHFSSVTLMPGPNAFSLTTNKLQLAEAPPTELALRVGQLRLYRPSSITTTDSSICPLVPAQCGVRVVATFPIETSLAHAPVLFLRAREWNSASDAAIEVQSGQKRLLCQVGITERELDLRAALESCAAYQGDRRFDGLTSDPVVHRVTLLNDARTSMFIDAEHAAPTAGLASNEPSLSWADIVLPLADAEGYTIGLSDRSADRYSFTVLSKDHVRDEKDSLIVLRGPATPPTSIAGRITETKNGVVEIRRRDGALVAVPLTSVQQIENDLPKGPSLTLRWTFATGIAEEHHLRLVIDRGIESGEIVVRDGNGHSVRSSLEPSDETGKSESYVFLSDIASAPFEVRSADLKLHFSSSDGDSRFHISIRGDTPAFGTVVQSLTNGAAIRLNASHPVAKLATGDVSGLANVGVISLDPRLSTLVVGPQHCPCAPERAVLVKAQGEGFAIVSAQPAGRQIITFNDSFSPDWMGLRLGFPKLLPHVLVDNWRNGWIEDGAGDVLLINLSDVAQMLLILFGSAIVIALWRRRATSIR